MSTTRASAFAEYARYYDLLYRDKDYVGEADYVDRLVRRFKPDAESMLELGSGTGRHALLLTERGYAICGIERSEEMLACSQRLVAQEKSRLAGRTFPVFAQGDVRSARVTGTFDAVISLFHVMSYQTTNDDLLASFQTARTHLTSNGLFVFDVWYGPAVLTKQPSVRVKRAADEETEVTRLAEPITHPNENLVDVQYHVFMRDIRTGVVTETRETHRMRYLFMPDLALLLRAAGLEILHVEEWMTGRKPSFDTWGVCVVAGAIEKSESRAA